MPRSSDPTGPAGIRRAMMTEGRKKNTPATGSRTVRFSRRQAAVRSHRAEGRSRCVIRRSSLESAVVGLSGTTYVEKFYITIAAAIRFHAKIRIFQCLHRSEEDRGGQK